MISGVVRWLNFDTLEYALPGIGFEKKLHRRVQQVPNAPESINYHGLRRHFRCAISFFLKKVSLVVPPLYCNLNGIISFISLAPWVYVSLVVDIIG